MFCRSVQPQAGSWAPEKTAHGEPAGKSGMERGVEAGGGSLLMLPLDRVVFIPPYYVQSL